MQHPFDGITGAGQKKAEVRQTRRSMLGRALAAVAGLFGAGATASAQTPFHRPTTLAFGEEGAGRVPHRRVPTTFALGEVGGPRPPVIQVAPVPALRRPTTVVFGEEAGRMATTFALGEEGGRAVTTLALDEEGGILTTRLLLEEG